MESLDDAAALHNGESLSWACPEPFWAGVLHFPGLKRVWGGGGQHSISESEKAVFRSMVLEKHVKSGPSPLFFSDCFPL